jgi:hypothetical protein
MIDASCDLLPSILVNISDALDSVTSDGCPPAVILVTLYVPSVGVSTGCSFIARGGMLDLFSAFIEDDVSVPLFASVDIG